MRCDTPHQSCLPQLTNEARGWQRDEVCNPHVRHHPPLGRVSPASILAVVVMFVPAELVLPLRVLGRLTIVFRVVILLLLLHGVLVNTFSHHVDLVT